MKSMKFGERILLCGEEYILANPRKHRAIFINTTTGRRWGKAHWVNSQWEISEGEFAAMTREAIEVSLP